MTDRMDILVFGAHADDAEIGMGGTIAKHVQAGFKVAVCDLTCSELSSNGTVERRKKEAEEASRILGLAERSNLGLPDRGIFVCQEHIEAVAMEIRRLRPRIVFAPYSLDRHPDHVLCGQIVTEAVFNAKLRRLRPDIDSVAVEAVYYYYINDVAEPDLMIDISDCYETKQRSLLAYESQFESPVGREDVVWTPLNQGYLERVEARDRVLGMKRQVAYAEGFATKVPYLTSLLL
ncbi:bacillithiol biosynthesis deacetylase BshB1 [Gorillibacterium timonense]|uniref:bacillithiol biosynthesis deacetylase BshB1 n=1 Tax=Gorillibacterium timonense TaxID=1689269 RepID=UPI00071CC32C|nr:bacillithiol biosynthesis deacetylase BshB1 [Gorillibacterium timonense]